MRKIYLVVATFFLAAMSYAQYDLAVAFTDPASGSQVEASGNFPVSFTITNNGPDAVPADHVIWMTWLIANQTSQANYSFDGTPQGVDGVIVPELPAGAQITSADLVPVFGEIAFNLNPAAAGDAIILWVLGVTDQQGDPSTLIEGDPNDGNNDNNMDMFFIGTPSGLSPDVIANLNVYPNPATDVVNFDAQGVNGNVTISSITGQVVANAEINNVAKVNVSHLNNGVYIYAIRDNDGNIIKTNKLIIQK